MNHRELYLQPSDYSVMRLGQLSRKINTKPTEILAYIKNEFDVELGTHLNTKVDDTLAEKVITKFGKVDSVPDVAEVPELEEVEVIDSTSTTESTEEASSKVPESIEPVTEYAIQQDVNPEVIAKAPLIKAPKVELSGPTVVGKIDLPPPLSEQMVEVDGVMMSKQAIADQKKEKWEERKKKSRSRNEKRSSDKVRSSRKNSEEQIAQMKHDREQKDLAHKLALREKRIAKKAKEEKKPKSVYVPKKTKKKAVAPIRKEIKKVQNTKPENLSVLGKIWKWFNT